MCTNVCAQVRVFGILHGQRAVIFLMYNELMTVYFFFNNLLDRSDIYLFLHFKIKNMKEASLNVLNVAFGLTVIE